MVNSESKIFACVILHKAIYYRKYQSIYARETCAHITYNVFVVTEKKVAGVCDCEGLLKRMHEGKRSFTEERH